MLSKSIKETEEIAKIFLKQVLQDKNKSKGALVVGLSGDLGAGKTAFTQSVARHLGIKSKVNSPTYIIMQKYSIALKGYKFLFHMDAYRLESEKELLHLGWEEIIGNKEHLVFVEWPEMIQKAMPKKHHVISITHTKEGKRKFKLK